MGLSKARGILASLLSPTLGSIATPSQRLWIVLREFADRSNLFVFAKRDVPGHELYRTLDGAAPDVLLRMPDDFVPSLVGGR